MTAILELPQEMDERIAELAQLKGRSKSELVLAALEDWLRANLRVNLLCR